MKFRTTFLSVPVLLVILSLALAACNSAVGEIEEAGMRGVITVQTPAYFAETVEATANPGGESWVQVECFQSRALVYTQTVQVDEDNKAYLTLGPTWRWTGGNADCTAEELVRGKKLGQWRVVARTTFEAIDPSE